MTFPRASGILLHPTSLPSPFGIGDLGDEAYAFADLLVARKYLHTSGEDIHWDFIRAVFASMADTAIIPLQDLLGLGTEGRMNLPNSTEDNWSWRFAKEDLTDIHGERLRDLTETYGRTPKHEVGSIRLDQDKE